MAIVALLAPRKSTAQNLPDEIRCSYERQVVCNVDGCEEMELAGSYLLIPALSAMLASTEGGVTAPSQIRRCDEDGCTPAAVRTATSGIFVNVWKSDGGYMLKMATQTQDFVQVRRGDFVEVATSLLATIIGYGRCERL